MRKKYVKPCTEAIHVVQQQQLMQASEMGDIDTGNNFPTDGIDGPPVFTDDELSPEFAL